jgi:putative transposase
VGRWRQQFRGMGDDEIKRMRQLEEDNRRLLKAVADLDLPPIPVPPAMRVVRG